MNYFSDIKQKAYVQIVFRDWIKSFVIQEFDIKVCFETVDFSIICDFIENRRDRKHLLRLTITIDYYWFENIRRNFYYT